MKYDAVIFDFDYTLADATRGIVESFQYAFNGLSLGEYGELSIKKTVGLALKEAFVELTGRDNEKEIGNFITLFKEKADQIMAGYTVLYPDTIGLLQKLKNDGCKTGIVTNKYHYRIDEVLNLNHIENLVDIIVGNEDVVNTKPSPDGLLMVIDHFQLSKDKVLYIGDSIVDAKTAVGAGVDFIAVTTGTTQKEDFSCFDCFFIAKDLKEIEEKLWTEKE